MYNMLTNCQ